MAIIRFTTSEHCFVINELMKQYRELKTRIEEVEKELWKKVQPYAHLVKALDEIPGIDAILAMGIIAEASADMSSFKDERTFAAWAGVASGNNESAGKKKDQRLEEAIQHYEKSSSRLLRELSTAKSPFIAPSTTSLVFD